MFSGPDGPEGQDPTGHDRRVFIAASLVVGLSLFLPRPMNFSPVGALGLFAGAYAVGRSAWLYPLAALTVYVVALGEYPWLVLASVYIGFAVPALIGTWWLRGRARFGRVGGAALLTSMLFFLISNFGSWIVYGVPRGETLAFHYGLGIPLFWNTLAGDVVFTAALFGGYALFAERSLARESESRVVPTS